METLRYIITSFAILMAIQMNAQTSETYVVKRGESFSSIASKYGISENELRKQNPDAKKCYTGMKLNIKKPSTTSSTINRNETSTTQSTATHKSSTTTQVSKNYWDTFLNYSFQDGVNYFNDGKWSKAIKEFKKVMNNSHCTPEMKEACRKNIALAKEKRSEKRAAFWDNLSEGLNNLSNSMAEVSYKLQGGNTSPTQITTCPTSPSNTTASSMVSSKNFTVREPSNLDAQHLKELHEKGSTEVTFYENSTGKKSRHVNICQLCNGNPNTQLCVLCNGSGNLGVNYRSVCTFCNGVGHYCTLCNNRGYEDHVWVTDASGRLLTVDGQPVKSESEVSSYRSTTIQNSSSTDSKKMCFNCNGTGVVPNGADLVKPYGSKECYGNKYNGNNHVCKIIMCPTCHQSHCETLSLHKECKMCKGNGYR